MSCYDVYTCVRRVGPRIRKKDTNYRKALDPGLRLAITIRFLLSRPNLVRMLEYQVLRTDTDCPISSAFSAHSRSFFAEFL